MCDTQRGPGHTNLCGFLNYCFNAFGGESLVWLQILALKDTF